MVTVSCFRTPAEVTAKSVSFPIGGSVSAASPIGCLVVLLVVGLGGGATISGGGLLIGLGCETSSRATDCRA